MTEDKFYKMGEKLGRAVAHGLTVLYGDKDLRDVPLRMPGSCVIHRKIVKGPLETVVFVEFGEEYSALKGPFTFECGIVTKTELPILVVMKLQSHHVICAKCWPKG